MTDAQINALAHEYAGAVTPHDKDEFYYEAAFHRNEKEFCKALEWLSERFCVVEKSKLEAELHKIRLALGDGGRSEWEDEINFEKEYLLKELFPEIFKDEEK